MVSCRYRCIFHKHAHNFREANRWQVPPEQCYYYYILFTSLPARAYAFWPGAVSLSSSMWSNQETTLPSYMPSHRRKPQFTMTTLNCIYSEYLYCVCLMMRHMHRHNQFWNNSLNRNKTHTHTHTQMCANLVTPATSNETCTNAV